MVRILGGAGTTPAVRDLIELRANFNDLLRIDLARQLDKLDYHVEVTNETLALFVRFWLTANPPLPDAALAAAKAKGNERYEGFVEVLARKLEAGPRLAEELRRDVEAGG